MYERLQDLDYAREYLADCLQDDFPGTFFVALRHVIRARRGLMAQLARKLDLNRVGLYRALSETGNPGMKSIMAILWAMDLRLELAWKGKSRKKA